MKSVINKFSVVAKTYDQYAIIQEQVAKKLIALIMPQCNCSKEILEIGCGTGILTNQLIKLFPIAKITAIDISKAMLEVANAKLNSLKHVSLLHGDLESLDFRNKFALVTSSSALHWMLPLANTIKKIYGLMLKDGYFIFSIMLDGTLKELHRLRSAILGEQSFVTMLPTEQEVLQCLRKSGFMISENRVEILQISYPSAQELLRSIREQGVTSRKILASKKLLTKASLQQLIKEYDCQYCHEKGVLASYTIMYVVARKML